MSAGQSTDFLQMALAAYAESLVEDARVAVLGQTAEGLRGKLIELGARSVHVSDPERPVSQAQPDTGVHGVHAGSVDLVLIPDLGVFRDPRGVVAEARRMTGESGAVLLTAKNSAARAADDASAFEYYELYDWVAQQFAQVTMIGQWSFHGATFAAFGEAPDEGVSVDMQLASERVVERFVVLAAQREAGLEPYVVVELPAAEVEAARWLESPTLERDPRSAELESALAESLRQQERLSAEIAALRIDALTRVEVSTQTDVLTVRAEAAERRIAAVEKELAASAAAHARDVVRLEDALRERAHTLRALEAEVADRDRIVRDLLDVSAENRAGIQAVGDQARDAGLDENAALRAKLDALALELARRQAQAQAAEWAVAEAELRVRRASDAVPGTAGHDATATANVTGQSDTR
jgi:hypothetical protein